MYCDRASATVGPACNARGSRPAPVSVEAMEKLLPALMSSGPAWMQLDRHQSGLNPSFLVYMFGKKGSKPGCSPVQIYCISDGFGSLDLRQYSVLRLSLGCEETYGGSKDEDQDVLTILEGPARGRHFTAGKSKQAGIAWCLEELAVSFQTGQSE